MPMSSDTSGGIRRAVLAMALGVSSAAVAQFLAKQAMCWWRDRRSNPIGGARRADPIFMKCALSDAEVGRFRRQLVLPKVGVDGQRALLQSRVLIVGAGGLGCPVAMYLCAAGVGHLEIVDDDVVDVSNLHRQIGFSWRSSGQSKAEALRRRCLEINDGAEVVAHCLSLQDVGKAHELASGVHLVVDCTDNPRARYLVNDAVVRAGVPLLTAASVGLCGQLALYNFEGGPCLRCAFPSWPGAESAEPTASCEENGVLGPVPGVIGTLAAVEALKVLAGGAIARSCARERMLLYDCLDAAQPFRTMKIRKRFDCPCCGGRDAAVEGAPFSPSEDLLLPSAPKCGVRPPGEEVSELTAQDLRRRLMAGKPTVIIDVRASMHFHVNHLHGSENWQLADIRRAHRGEMQGRLATLKAAEELRCAEDEGIRNLYDSGITKDTPQKVEPHERRALVVCVCRRGVDSLHAARHFCANGCEASNLRSGLLGLVSSAPPELEPAILT